MEKRKRKIFLTIKTFLALFNAVYPIIFMIIPGLIINELTNEKRIEILIMYVCILTIFPLLIHIIRTYTDIYIEKTSMIIMLNIQREFYDHYISMDFESVENPEIGIMQERAQSTFNNTLQVVNNLCGLLGSLIGFIAISSIISTLNPILVVLVVVFTCMNLLANRLINKKKYLLGKKMSEVERYQSSANYMLYMVIYAIFVCLYIRKSKFKRVSISIILLIIGVLVFQGIINIFDYSNTPKYIINGELIEYGTHKQLYEKGDKYTEMFNKQACFYRNDYDHITN